MTAPVRVQLSRAKGWRMPANTVKVDRTTRWGNPFVPGQEWVRRRVTSGGGELSGICVDQADAVRLFRRFTARETQFRIEAFWQLNGRNLACWCKLGDPCHADVLLQLANPADPA